MTLREMRQVLIEASAEILAQYANSSDAVPVICDRLRRLEREVSMLHGEVKRCRREAIPEGFPGCDCEVCRE